MTWRTARSLLLAVAILVQGIDAIPGGLGSGVLAKPTAQAELDDWTHLLERVGIHTTNEALAERALEVARPPLRARRAILAVVRPIQKLFGTGQSWAFFAYPERFPQALVIEVRRAGVWTEVHHPFAIEEPTLGAALRYRRLRGVYTDSGARARPGAVWNNFVDWVADRMLTTDATIEGVRVSMERRSTDRGEIERRLVEERLR